MSTAIKRLEQDHKKLTAELAEGLKEMENGPLPQSRGDELAKKRREAMELQNRLDQYRETQEVISKGREIPAQEIPANPNGRKGQKRVKTTPGHLFVGSEAFKQYRANGNQGWSAKVDVKSIRGGQVKLDGDEAEAFEAKAFDPANLSDLGDDALIPYDRQEEIIRYEEPELLTMRDILTVSPTTKDTIRFVRHTATDRAAQSQAARGDLKPYLRVEHTTETVSVETIAVLSKVTEQDIDDAPRLIQLINGEMRLDVKVEEERQLLWGGGANGELQGLYDQGVEEFDRAQAGDTVIDTIRRMRTDLRKSRVIPNAVMIDPLDWEEIELEKGTDERYVWGLIQDVRGPRIWSLRVVESDAMTADSGERRILMGDFTRGATLYDRHDVRLAIGFVDDDFARNLRTLRAEERVALAVKRPWAFTYATTEAAPA
jgi:HK97 family phage major capsid protein